MKVLPAVLTLTLVTTLSAVNPYDPGICTKQKRGKFMVVKDHSDDDKIVVCVEHHGKYKWDMINGYSYGNYFDPAKDCSDVVDNVPKAKSGVYWIQTVKGPVKAWCDVDTSSGGFLLIGVKDTPETWAIPSNSSLVHPHGLARWSSAFGEKNVLDFRVQISTSKDFHDTRAHWYYHFKSPRILSKLLMSDEGGCSHRYPGIGNIAYVKDLMTRKMATKTFNCSRFGASIAPGLGWDKMNRCFKESCPIGFAYLPGYHIDTSGSYSYSVVSGRSGIQDSQTSFIGCDHGKCCACFGPDSKQDYCAPKCQAINGGTVLREKDNITVWFWIRSSLPKRVWKKCMEYKEKNIAGKMETWRVENGIRRKGPCSVPEDVTINDGVAVVPNNQSMNKLPKVEGLLSYLSDKKKLYIKEKSQWTALANQKEIKDVIGKLDSFKQEINNKLTTVNSKSEKRIKDVTGKLDSFKQEVNNKLTTVNKDVKDNKALIQKWMTQSEKMINDVSGKLNNFKQEINNKLTTVNKDVKVLTHKSCKQIWMSQSNKGSGVYQISVGNNKVINVYCQMTSVSSCSGGGWTMVMKIDGSSSTFKYSSYYWTSTSTYNDYAYGRNGGLDNRQYKGSTYWRTSFKEICVGMKYGGRLRAFSFSYPASSLYSLIADGNYRQTRVGRSQWRSLIHGSSLQRNCNREGFNIYVDSYYTRVRMGLVANNENDCKTPDSFIGLGADSNVCLYIPSRNAAGNLAQCHPDNGNKNTKAMGYILVR